jgi:hypothetical protein
LKGYDEPEILSCSFTPICPLGADAGHPLCVPRTAS